MNFLSMQKDNSGSARRASTPACCTFRSVCYRRVRTDAGDLRDPRRDDMEVGFPDLPLSRVQAEHRVRAFRTVRVSSSEGKAREKRVEGDAACREQASLFPPGLGYVCSLLSVVRDFGTTGGVS